MNRIKMFSMLSAAALFLTPASQRTQAASSEKTSSTSGSPAYKGSLSEEARKQHAEAFRLYSDVLRTGKLPEGSAPGKITREKDGSVRIERTGPNVPKPCFTGEWFAVEDGTGRIGVPMNRPYGNNEHQQQIQIIQRLENGGISVLTTEQYTSDAGELSCGSYNSYASSSSLNQASAFHAVNNISDKMNLTMQASTSFQPDGQARFSTQTENITLLPGASTDNPLLRENGRTHTTSQTKRYKDGEAVNSYKHTIWMDLSGASFGSKNESQTGALSGTAHVEKGNWAKVTLSDNSGDAIQVNNSLSLTYRKNALTDLSEIRRDGYYTTQGNTRREELTAIHSGAQNNLDEVTETELGPDGSYTITRTIRQPVRYNPGVDHWYPQEALSLEDAPIIEGQRERSDRHGNREVSIFDSRSGVWRDPKKDTNLDHFVIQK